MKVLFKLGINRGFTDTPNFVTTSLAVVVVEHVCATVAKAVPVCGLLRFAGVIAPR